jgi:hypothetical protein
MAEDGRELGGGLGGNLRDSRWYCDREIDLIGRAVIPIDFDPAVHLRCAFLPP